MAEKNLGKVAVTTGGTYASSKAYDKLTIVNHNGASWISKTAVPAGNAPSESSSYWQLLLGASVPRIAMTSASASINPNTFYVWGEVASLDITLNEGASAEENRYMFQFRNPKSGATVLTLPDDILWSVDTELGDDGLPLFGKGEYTRIEIIEGLASVKKWALPYIIFADAEVERVLLADGVGDGTGITNSDAAAVTTFGSTLFRDNVLAESFNEIKFFKNLQKIEGGAFRGASNLSMDLVAPSLTYIGTGAFYGSKITKVSALGEGCEIQNPADNLGGAFENCADLTEVSSEAMRNLRIIGHHAFFGTGLIGGLDLSNSESIGQNAFRGLQGVTNIILGSHCKKIMNGAFYQCINAVIDDLNCPSLTSLEGGAFNSTKVRKITSLGSVTSMPNDSIGTGGVFENCTELTEIAQEVLDKLTYIATAWRGCSNLRIDLILPNLTGTITHGFSKCPIQRVLNLGNITNLFGDAALVSSTYPFGQEYTVMVLPATLERIGRYAFAGDDNMQALIIKATTPPSLAAYAFSSSRATCPVYVPNASVEAYKGATNWNNPSIVSRIKGISDLQTDNPTLYAEIAEYL